MKVLNATLSLQGMGTTQMWKRGTGNLPPIIQLQTEALIHMRPGGSSKQSAGAREVSQVPPPHSPTTSPLFSDHPSGEGGGALGWPGNSALTGASITAKSGDKTSPRSQHGSPTPSTLPGWDHTTHYATTLPSHLLSLK